MEQKIKIIIVSLIGLIIASVVFNVLTLNSKSAVERQRDKLNEEGIALAEKLNRITKDYQRLDEKARALNQELEKASLDKGELQARCDALDKARQDLVEKVNTLQAKAAAEPQAPAVPETTDSYWAQVLKNKTNLEIQLESIRNELNTLKINNDQLEKDKGALQLEIKNLGLEKQDLKRQLGYNQKQLGYNQKLLDNVALELVGEKNDKTQISDTFKAIKNENLILRRQLKNLNNRKVALERKIQAAQEQNFQLEKKFSESDILLQEKTLQVDSLKGQMSSKAPAGGAAIGREENNLSVELPPIVVRPQATDITQLEAREKAKSPMSGRVLAVNRENNFVIIDLGQGSGIKIGDTFQVSRDNNIIGSVEAIQVRKTISACDIKKEDMPIRIGDTLR